MSGCGLTEVQRYRIAAKALVCVSRPKGLKWPLEIQLVVICLRELVDYLKVLEKLVLRLIWTLRIDLQWVVVLFLVG